MFETALQPFAGNLLILDHRDSVLSMAPLLEALAARCGQPGAMHWLPYFLDKSVLRHRRPRLVLFLKPEEIVGESLQAQDLVAAALFFEYEVLGLRTGVVATADAVGFNTVIAPEELRAKVAAVAARALSDGGAAVVIATYGVARGTNTGADLPGQVTPDGARWAWRTRQVPRMLALQPTMDETLAQMGKSTRANLRYYRRRLEKLVPCEFVPESAPLLDGADLEQLNASSLNPVPAEDFARRIRCASELPGSFLCGLRDEKGRWLSLVGGWRQAETTVLFWQMNTAGLEKHSIGTVMRSFFLEHEIERGARRLLVFGGTPHSMRHAFTHDPVSDLVVARRGSRAFLIRCAARLLGLSGASGGARFVAEALLSAQFAPPRRHDPVKQRRYAGALARGPAERTA